MNPKVVKIVLGVFAVVFLGTAVWVFFEYRYWNSPWGTEEDRFLYDFPDGASGRYIGEVLKEKGIIDNVTMFLIIADLRGIAHRLQAGEFEFVGTETRYEVLDKIARGRRYWHAVVIPEGWTQEQILQRYDAMGICPAEILKAEFDNTPVFPFVVATAPRGMNAQLEGALFPDTYFLEKRTPSIKIMERHLRRFNEVMDELYEEALEKASNRWWWQEDDEAEDDLHKVVVLASIIEREASSDEDRGKIASAFVNRLRRNMPLQSDATIHYALGDWSRSLTLRDLEVDSPYNTYKNTGLPPAAICNPGKASLRAAMMPPETDYIFFIAMPDGATRFTGNYNEFLSWKNTRRNEINQRRADVEEEIESPEIEEANEGLDDADEAINAPSSDEEAESAP